MLPHHREPCIAWLSTRQITKGNTNRKKRIRKDFEIFSRVHDPTPKHLFLSNFSFTRTAGQITLKFCT